MRIVLIICLSQLLFATACKKQEPPFSETPEISFSSVAPQQVLAFKDSITFTIFYKDGDGDLGENNAHAENLFLTDNRINLVYKYRIKQLAPQGDPIPIQGRLSVILDNTTLTDSSSEQSATFSIYMVDRAGNKSNVITSPPVNILKN